MDLKLKDKVAIVTGAGSQVGYGKGICLALAREGCHVVADDKDEQFEGAKKTAEECKKLGVKAIAFQRGHPGEGGGGRAGEDRTERVRQD
ncbi:MAG: SDR family NAD(P)-dependent oxidoreductase [Chloroflexota bacterium]